MNKPLYKKGDRIPGTLGIVVHVYRPHKSSEFVYTIAFGNNYLQLLGSQLREYFPTA